MVKTMIGMRRAVSVYLAITFMLYQTGFAQVANEANLAGYLGRLSSGIAVDSFRPLHLRYFSYDQLADKFQVLLDKGDAQNIQGEALQNSAQNLMTFFLIGVTLPDDSFWVNLRPDAADRITDDSLAQTDIGKILLEADLQLKKDTARLTNPQTAEGRQYWHLLYQKADELFGAQEDLEIPALIRPWIVPGEVIIRETESSAYIYKATLKVCLEQDHIKNSDTYNFSDPRLKALNEYSAGLIRQLILPKLTKQVNTAKRYSQLRQVYYSLILSRWFKSRFAGKSGTYVSLINQKNLTGLTSGVSWSQASYFKEYQKSFKNGEYSQQETVGTPYGQTIRTYTSGGVDMDFSVPAAGKVSSGAVGGFFGKADLPGLLLGNNANTLAVFSGTPATGILVQTPRASGSRVGSSPATYEAKITVTKFTKIDPDQEITEAFVRNTLIPTLEGLIAMHYGKSLKVLQDQGSRDPMRVNFTQVNRNIGAWLIILPNQKSGVIQGIVKVYRTYAPEDHRDAMEFNFNLTIKELPPTAASPATIITATIDVSQASNNIHTLDGFGPLVAAPLQDLDPQGRARLDAILKTAPLDPVLGSQEGEYVIFGNAQGPQVLAKVTYQERSKMHQEMIDRAAEALDRRRGEEMEPGLHGFVRVIEFLPFGELDEEELDALLDAIAVHYREPAYFDQKDIPGGVGYSYERIPESGKFKVEFTFASPAATGEPGALETITVPVIGQNISVKALYKPLEGGGHYLQVDLIDAAGNVMWLPVKDMPVQKMPAKYVFGYLVGGSAQATVEWIAGQLVGVEEARIEEVMVGLIKQGSASSAANVGMLQQQIDTALAALSQLKESRELTDSLTRAIARTVFPIRQALAQGSFIERLTPIENLGKDLPIPTSQRAVIIAGIQAWAQLVNSDLAVARSYQLPFNSALWGSSSPAQPRDINDTDTIFQMVIDGKLETCRILNAMGTDAQVVRQIDFQGGKTWLVFGKPLTWAEITAGIDAVPSASTDEGGMREAVGISEYLVSLAWATHTSATIYLYQEMELRSAAFREKFAALITQWLARGDVSIQSKQAFAQAVQEKRWGDATNIYAQAGGRVKDKSGSSSPLEALVSPADSELKPGGIDFRSIPMLVQSMGSFAGLAMTVPNIAVLSKLNLDTEASEMKALLVKGSIPDSVRIKNYIWACYAQQTLSDRLPDIICCLAQICRMQEDEVLESDPELRESLMLVDAGLE